MLQIFLEKVIASKATILNYLASNPPIDKYTLLLANRLISAMDRALNTDLSSDENALGNYYINFDVVETIVHLFVNQEFHEVLGLAQAIDYMSPTSMGYNYIMEAAINYTPSTNTYNSDLDNSTTSARISYLTLIIDNGYNYFNSKDNINYIAPDLKLLAIDFSWFNSDFTQQF